MESHALPAPIGSQQFGPADQELFAGLTGDRNPMHVDPVAARRLLTGRAVVHGVHTLMHALERCRWPEPAGPLQLAATFVHSVSVGETVCFDQQRGTDGQLLLRALVDGVVCTEIVIGPVAAAAPAAPIAPARPVRHLPRLQQALDEAPGSQCGHRDELAVPDGAWATHFPKAAARLGARTLAALGQLSTYVGMVCPGLHSVFSSLRVDLSSSPDGDVLGFELARFDPRFRLCSVDFSGALRGELRAFVRPPPQRQPPAREVAQAVAEGSFAGQRAMVIGGSRGLGEITAKILAAGGAEVVLTYAAGKDDARAVADDIAALGRGACRALHLDLDAGLAALPEIDPQRLDAIYLFATPRILARRGDVFDRAAFDRYATMYLDRLQQLCSWANRGPRARRLRVYWPSTVYVEQRPRGMTEYAAAKAAAELLSADLNRQLRHVEVISTRLPRLATDQTASLLKSDAGDPLQAMLEVVRLVSPA